MYQVTFVVQLLLGALAVVAVCSAMVVGSYCKPWKVSSTSRDFPGTRLGRHHPRENFMRRFLPLFALLWHSLLAKGYALLLQLYEHAVHTNIV